VRHAEERVAGEEVSDPAEFTTRVGQETTADLFAAMLEMKGSLPKKLARRGSTAAVSVLPTVGTFASVLSTGETVAEPVKGGRTWHAALIKLRDTAGDYADRRSPRRVPLPPRLLSGPLVEHGAREADVPPDPMARRLTHGGRFVATAARTPFVPDAKATRLHSWTQLRLPTSRG
jgi:hypothetical protein